MSPRQLRLDCRAAYLLRILSDLESGSPRQTWFLALARAADRQLLEYLPQRPTPPLLDRVIGRLLPWLGPGARWLMLRRCGIRGLLPYQLAAREPFPAPVALLWPATVPAMLSMAHEGLWINLCLLAGMAGVNAGGSLVLVAGIACVAFGCVFVAIRSLFQSTAALARQNLTLRDEPVDWSAGQEEAAGDLPEWLVASGLKPEDSVLLAARLLADPDRYLDEALCRRLKLVPVPRVRPLGRAAALFVAFAGGALLPLLPFVWLPERWRLPAMLLVGLAGLVALAWRRARWQGLSPLESAARHAMLGATSVGLAYAAGRLLTWLFNR